MGQCLGERVWEIRKSLPGIKTEHDVLRLEKLARLVAHEFTLREEAWGKEEEFIYGVYTKWAGKHPLLFLRWLTILEAYCFWEGKVYVWCAFITVFYLLLRDWYPSGDNFF